MKYSLKLLAVIFALTVGCVGSQAVFAQSGGSNTQPLTFQDKMKLAKARNQVFESNPGLKTEAANLKQQGQALKDGSATPRDKIKFARALDEHEKKMKSAMLQVDPSLAPIIDQAEAEMKQKMKDRADGN